MVRLILRRDRIRLPLWIGGITIGIAAIAQSYADTYPTQEALNNRAELAGSPLFKAFNGPGYGLDDYTLGAMVANESLYIGVILVALMSILLVVRHTRAEEESGRAELVRSTVVGRHAAMMANVFVVGMANVAVGLLVTAGLASGLEELDWTGSLAYGLSMLATGLVFTGVGAVAAQVSEYGRGAVGLGVAVLAATYLMRAVGDAAESGLSWISPLMWSLATRPYVDERWWPLLLSIALAAGLLITAIALSARRDVGSGIVPPRPGPAIPTDRLVSITGVAARLQRTGVLAWTGGALVLGASFGALADEVEEFASGNEQIQELFSATAGISLLDSFLAAIVLMIVLIATSAAIQSMMRARHEELAGRAEPVLATAVSRDRWIGGHLAVALATGIVVAMAGVTGLGVTAAVSRGDWSLLADLILAGVTYLPAIALVVGLAVALFGNLPRAMPLTWLFLANGIVVGLLGDALGLPAWARNLSPFDHIPRLPGTEVDLLPIATVALVAAALIAAGMTGFRRRDVAVK
jgi:ABC-2 type transport system permease protein